MNTAVSKLLDVDKEARQQLDEAQQYYERIMQEIQEEKQALKQLYQEKGRAHIDTLREQLEKEAAEMAREVEQVQARQMAALQEQYDQHHAAWEDHLFHAVIGR